MTQNLDEPEWLLAFFEACTTHRRTAELLGGVEELVLKGFHKRAGGSEAVQSELAAALLASCGNLKVLALEEATVWGSTFYERLADGLNNSCSSSSRGCKGLQEASSPSGLVEGHVEPVCHLEGGSSSSLSGQIGEHADTVCHKESTGGSDTAIYTAFHRSAQAAAGCLDSQVRNLHLQKNGNRQVQSDSAQSPAPGGRSPKANSPPKESRDRQCQSSTLQAPASEGCFPKATPPPKEERDTQGRTDTFHAPFHALPSSTRPTHSQQPALCSSTWMHLHTLKLPTSGCMCFQPELRAIAALRSLQHLQLGQAGVYQRRSSFDLSPLSSLTALKTLQLACDSVQVGWAIVLSCCSQLIRLEVNHGCPLRLPDFHHGSSSSLQCLVISHCLSLKFLPHIVVATSAKFQEIVLLNKATWGGSLVPEPMGLTAGDRDRLAGMHMSWGPSGLIIDSVSRAIVLPCATPLAKLEPLLNNTQMAKCLQALHLESVSFQAGEMASLAALFPLLRKLALESCVLDCWAVFEAVQGWESLETLVFVGNEHTTSGCSTTEASLPSIAALLRTRALNRQLHVAYYLCHGVHDDIFNHIKKVQAGLSSGGALVSWRIDEQHDDDW